MILIFGLIASLVLLQCILEQDLFLVGPSETFVVGPSALLEVGPSDDLVVAPSQAVLVESSPEFVVEPPPRGAWDEKGWAKNGAEWTGYFEATDTRTGIRRRFQGRVAMERGVAQPYIHDPPPEIKRHPRGPCFHLWKPAPWFKVNWNVPATNVDDAILYVERVLHESFAR